MRKVDLRSDTVTLPSQEMRDAMYRAELGDDVYGEDPTVNKLEQLAAEITGKEAALFVSSGTMGNLVALLTHCGRGEAAILGGSSHIFIHEQGSASTLGSIHMVPIVNENDGSLQLSQIESWISVEDDHVSRTRLVCLENAINGSVLSSQYVQSFIDLARKNKLSTHLDGARIFNAARALSVPVKELTQGFDSIQFCFSKGLSAPAGSVVCGTKEFIREARRWRKAVGGGMRQVGVLAAACIYAVENMVDRLLEDHQNARRLAARIEEIPGLLVNRHRLDSNMVWFDVNLPGVDAVAFVKKLAEKQVLMLEANSKTIRAVTHYGITAEDIDTACDTIEQVVEQIRSEQLTRA